MGLGVAGRTGIPQLACAGTATVIKVKDITPDLPGRICKVRLAFKAARHGSPLFH